MMDARPIPAFYCCYLLRSTVRHSSLYVGSTPNPIRRLAQHNGVSKGGAVKTSRESLRPWEMSCIVSGFPSHVAALQFEWAWQNTHLTRHIPAPQRLTEARTSVRISPKTGRTRRRPARPRVCLTDKISNLHLLLRVDSFVRWPLEVRFYCEDVYKIWQRWTERVDGKIRDGVSIILDLEQPHPTKDIEEPNVLPASNQAQAMKTVPATTGGLKSVDATYAGMKPHAEKTKSLLAREQQPQCAVCRNQVEKKSAFLVTCPHPGCDSISHMICLATRWLATEGQEDMVIPVEGSCPSCKTRVKWIDMAKELSLRANGPTQLAKLLKKPREKKTKAAKPKNGKGREASPSGDIALEARDQDDNSDSDLSDEVASMELAGSVSLSDYYDELEVEDDLVSISSVISLSSEETGAHLKVSEKGVAGQKPGIVIDDSEWDDAEVLD